jgi:AcrR family transcriptional regulator
VVVTASHPRRTLSERQRRTVSALVDATLELIEEVGADELTIRTVAGRAEVTHTTAYTYFSSKEHLICEAFWRLLDGIPRSSEGAPGRTADRRVIDALAAPARSLAQRPALARAALAAMVATDPDVAAVRDQVGADLTERLQRALGDGADRRLPETLLLAFSGAMLQAGMGYFDFDGVVDRIATVVRQLGLDRR